MINVLFAAGNDRWAQYRDVLPAALQDAGIRANLGRDLDPETVDYIVYAPNPDLTDFTPYRNARAVLCLWAGV
ncbi:MAG: glyoxylate/hydroxypyruvate reductase A, partial [Rhodobacter sp.]|nr:glyoxylate/hydroxypyruvate reductase A [Rhodobacter sp.]